MKNIIKKQLKKAPYLKGLYENIDFLKEGLEKSRELKHKEIETKKLIERELERVKELRHIDATEKKAIAEELEKYKTWVAPGHFYSPIPDIDEIKKKEKGIFGAIPAEIPGIDLRFEKQKKLLNELQKFYPEVPFKDKKTGSLRYFFENPAYSYADAVFLYLMLRHLRPKNIIEVGSGYSSCVMLDTNELFLGNKTSKTSLIFIELYPELLYSLIREDDKENENIEIIPQNLQDIDLEKFSSLNAGDILFIDSTHVSKANSDVNYIFFKLLPSLKKGVYIHFHDIFYPFEYPKSWIYEGRAWNEDYMMRAFLQYNNDFEIVYFIDYMKKSYGEEIAKMMPLTTLNEGGGIWLRKK